MMSSTITTETAERTRGISTLEVSVVIPCLNEAASIEACVRAAAKAGELREIPVRRDLRAWFVHHLAFALMVNLQPKVPAIDYGIPKTTLVVQAVWFVLRGLGLEDEAIRRHYHPEALSRLRP